MLEQASTKQIDIQSTTLRDTNRTWSESISMQPATHQGERMTFLWSSWNIMCCRQARGKFHLREPGPCAAELAAGAEHDDVQVGAWQRQPRGLAPEQRRAAARPHGARRRLDAPHRFRQQVHLRLQRRQRNVAESAWASHSSCNVRV